MLQAWEFARRKLYLGLWGVDNLQEQIDKNADCRSCQVAHALGQRHVVEQRWWQTRSDWEQSPSLQRSVESGALVSLHHSDVLRVVRV
jgi:hypothetical protein